MSTVRFTLLGVLLTLGSSRCLQISHWDLEHANITCDGKSTCSSSSRERSRLADEVLWSSRNCMCDPACAQYGDCCLDSAHFAAAEQRRGAASVSCISVDAVSYGIYMLASCPPEWEQTAVRLSCEAAAGQDLSLTRASDPLMEMPLTSHNTGYTYRNAFCALCHGENLSSRLDFWNPLIQCPGVKDVSLDEPEARKLLVSQLEWNAEESAWTLNNSVCAVKASIPITVQHLVRRCLSDLRQACSVNWTNANVRTRCEAYTSIVYSGAIAYRNPHCAICNNVAVNILSCNRLSARGGFGGVAGIPPAFSVLFDWSDLNGGSVGQVQLCPDPGELFDPFKKICRKLVCEDDRVFSEGKCIASPSASSEGNDVTQQSGALEIDKDGSGKKNSPNLFLECPKFILSSVEYTLEEDNSSVWVPIYNRRFEEFLIDNDGSLILCSDTIGISYMDKFGTYMSYVTVIGLGVSIIFLLLHLIAFLILPDLRNLSGKNLASYCLSLLFAYCSFIAGQLMHIAGSACIAAASFTQYAFLSAFAWMLILAFDVWRSLQLATSELRVSSGRQWRKFLAYSLFGWFSPLVFVIAALAVDSAPHGSVDNFFRPGFGVISCWFASRKALLVFFGLPIVIVMALNIVFFAHSAYMIWSTTSTTRYTSSAVTRRDFRLYGRLAIVMGLTWSIGIIAGYVNLEGLWYAFIALNTLQGLFIFLAFTCKEKVARGILAHCRCLGFGSISSGLGDSKHHLRPPSFSWSGDSDTTRKSPLATSTSDLRHPAFTVSQNSHHNSMHLPTHQMQRTSLDALY